MAQDYLCSGSLHMMTWTPILSMRWPSLTPFKNVSNIGISVGDVESYFTAWSRTENRSVQSRCSTTCVLGTVWQRESKAARRGPKISSIGGS